MRKRFYRNAQGSRDALFEGKEDENESIIPKLRIECLHMLADFDYFIGRHVYSNSPHILARRRFTHNAY